MKWKSEPDKGIYNAMNKGILRTKGDIIGIVNSDDWLESDALEIVETSFIENGRDKSSLYSGGIFFHKKDGTVKRWDVNIKSFKRQVPLYIISGIRHPATFVPRQVYDKIGLYDDQMHLSTDQDFILRCHFGGVKIIEISQLLSNMSEGRLSTTGSEVSRMMAAKDRRLMLRKFGKNGLAYWWLLYSWEYRGIL